MKGERASPFTFFDTPTSPMTPPRVRFAPSPTGYLHVGGARTALFNWLYARHTGGTIVLRIEDTDRARSTEAHTRVILDGLELARAHLGRGPVLPGRVRRPPPRRRGAPARRGQGLPLLLHPGGARAQRRAGRGGGRRLPLRPPLRPALRRGGRARGARAGAPFTIRFLRARRRDRLGRRGARPDQLPGRDLDDFVILRSDGTPIYNLAVVSDDIAMRITLVIRGDDHISNTPKQIVLTARSAPRLPVFAHVPMILGPDGKKLSKRHGATAVGDYQHQGILPAAMRNFLALLGWSPGGDREIMPEAEMIELFTLEGIQKKAAVFDTKKLEWMNGQYLSRTARRASWLPAVRRELDADGRGTSARGICAPLIDAVKTRSRTILHVAERVAVRLDPSPRDARREGRGPDPEDGPGLLRQPAARRRGARAGCGRASGAPSAFSRSLKQLAEAHGLKLGDAMQPVRVALTGSTVSEPVNELLAVVDRDDGASRGSARSPQRTAAATRAAQA